METENLKTKKGYWFSLKSYIYVDFKEKGILLYNTQNGHYKETTSKDIVALISELYEPQNLGVTFLSHQLYCKTHINEFILSILNEEMGALLDVERYPQKPICLIPILNLQKDVEKLQKNKNNNHFISTGISNYLLELNIYLNNDCLKNCTYCENYCMQIHCCTTNINKQELTFTYLADLLKQVRYSSIGKINILGGDIFQYSDFSKLKSPLEDFKRIVHFYLHYENFRQNETLDLFQLVLIVNIPVNEIIFNDIWSEINKEKTTIHFVVENEEQYTKAEQLIEKYNIERYEIKSFYTKENIYFFKENVFMNKEDVFSKQLQMREIFRNQKLNSNFFGTLYVLPDGIVKANMNTQELGNIKKDKVLDLIHKEMLMNTAWRQVRNLEPCNKCNYQFICPSPSNYEKTLNINNLCTVSV